MFIFTKFHGLGFIVLLTALAPLPADAQLKAVPIDELADSMRLHPKPALILISTSWCTYCRIQQAQLKKSKELQKALHVYFSEFDAETKDDVVFNDTTYRFKSTGVSTGNHELAFALGSINNRLAFPTWVVINEKFEIILKFPGVVTADKLPALLEAALLGLPPE